MLAILAIICFALFIIFLLPIITKHANREPAPHSQKFNMQMKKLWTIAQSSMKESKPLRAEKALLTILKFDEKNAAAYNRLGILYAKENKFDEAIECFEIAQSLNNNPSSLHNVGLIYLETGAYEKAEMAFLQAIELEGDVPSRFIALAKAQEKLGKRREAINSLESAFELESSTPILRQILALYEAAEDEEMIAVTTARIESQVAAAAAKKKRPARRPSPRPVSRPVSRAPRQSESKSSAPRPKPLVAPNMNRSRSRRRKIIQ